MKMEMKAKTKMEMKMKRKLLCLALAFALIVGVAAMAGCNRNAGTTPSTTGAAEVAATTTSGAAEAAATTAGGDSGDSGDLSVVLVTMDSMDQHWVNVDAGCKDAAAELGVKYQWMAPDRKDDAMQIEKINNAVASGANAILIAANSPTSVNSALQEAADKGIKIVYVDSPAEFPAIATVATNNKQAGKTAGDQLLKALADKGVTSGAIGVISVNAATQSTVDRDAGFREAFAGSAYEILETQYGEGDAAKSKEIGDAYITQGVVGIFGTNEGSAVGAGNAIKDAGNSVIGVGFDQSPSAEELIKDGALLCVMAQEPYQMGFKGMSIAVQALRGEAIAETNIDSGAKVVDAAALGVAVASSQTAAGGELSVVLITMDSMDQHWVNVDAGCRDAAGERAVKYQWMAPDKKDDAMQIEKINNAVASGANAILVAANNPTGVNSALQEAADKGIIIVYVDSPAEFPAIATVATNNKAAGRSAGEEMLKALAAGNVTSGTIGVISVNAATQSVVDRDAGFREALAGSEFEVLETQYGEGDAAKSKEIGDAYITQGVVGIYGTNEGSSIGAGNAIKDSGKDVVGVGFDYGDAAAQLIKDGALLCVMAQEPYQMGYKGLNIAVQALRGEAIPETNIDSGATAIFD